MAFEHVIEAVGKVVDAAGIVIIVGGTLIATVMFIHFLRNTSEPPDAYTRYRRGIGRSILLGLEFLVAADIIRTVAIAPTFQSVGVLAIIVLIRTFLSIELEMEIDGRWPWQHKSVSISATPSIEDRPRDPLPLGAASMRPPEYLPRR